jgi:hypothetical protein
VSIPGLAGSAAKAPLLKTRNIKQDTSTMFLMIAMMIQLHQPLTFQRKESPLRFPDLPFLVTSIKLINQIT